MAFLPRRRSGPVSPSWDFGGELVTADMLDDYREPSAWAVKGGLYLALRNTDTEESLDGVSQSFR